MLDWQAARRIILHQIYIPRDRLSQSRHHVEGADQQGQPVRHSGDAHVPVSAHVRSGLFVRVSWPDQLDRVLRERQDGRISFGPRASASATFYRFERKTARHRRGGEFLFFHRNCIARNKRLKKARVFTVSPPLLPYRSPFCRRDAQQDGGRNERI